MNKKLNIAVIRLHVERVYCGTCEFCEANLKIRPY